MPRTIYNLVIVFLYLTYFVLNLLSSLYIKELYQQSSIPACNTIDKIFNCN